MIDQITKLDYKTLSGCCMTESIQIAVHVSHYTYAAFADTGQNGFGEGGFRKDGTISHCSV
ncbi:hypothetical protein GWA01_06350 [Gluconobacter wancherniae NBRC 103581]|uniref:Uncharacterized protein n=1 Tax=Gluconobacter wancherniae NBRC 103581 TaxID=656744 RepID=A0A511AXD2_9PROT|nr:hypothetical protein AA103581_0819 [Gluconobacter wancherniae NBRC 103581]GEK92865.1 hypothetical protein GWA01_06350 [Gluconobacter wancherniae NBRC 103581]